MGKKLGDYIHYHYKNYLQQGIDLYEGERPNPVAILNQQHEDILKRAEGQVNQVHKAGIKESLEYQLNFFFANSNDLIKYGMSPQDMLQLQQTISKLAEQGVGSAINRAHINYTDLSVSAMDNINLGKISEEFRLLNKTQIGIKNKGHTTYQALNRRLHALIQLQAQLQTQAMLNNTENDFINKMTVLQNTYSQLISEIQQRKTGFAINMNQNFITELNELIKMTNQHTIQNIEGALGEYIPAITQKVLEAYSTYQTASFSEEIEKSILDSVKKQANSRSFKGISSQKVIAPAGSGQEVLQLGDTKISSYYTLDKVDIMVDVPEEELIGASVKNYNINAKSINILNGVSLLKYLQDYPEFANHYLNLTTIHAIGGPSGTLLEQAHRTMLLTIALGALMGASQGRQVNSDKFMSLSQAELLIINRTTAGQQRGNFQVYFMSDIIKEIEQRLDLVRFEGIPVNQPKLWEMEYVGKTPNVKAAYRRAANVLAQLHQQQLNVSLSTDALT